MHVLERTTTSAYFVLLACSGSIVSDPGRRVLAGSLVLVSLVLYAGFGRRAPARKTPAGEIIDTVGHAVTHVAQQEGSVVPA